jgi:hypothetical protein
MLRTNLNDIASKVVERFKREIDDERVLVRDVEVENADDQPRDKVLTVRVTPKNTMVGSNDTMVGSNDKPDPQEDKSA